MTVSPEYQFVVLDPAGNFDNVILWDRIEPFTVPEGYTLVPIDSPQGQAAIAANEQANIAAQQALKATQAPQGQ